jgi:O-antigen ligase
MFIYSGVLTSFCILLLGKPYRDDEGTLTRHIRYSYRLIGPEIQNNQLATYIASVSPFVFYNFIKRKKIIDFIFFIIIFYGTYKTGSRAAILSIVLSVVIIFLSSINSKRIKYVYYIAFILFTIILFLIMPSSIKDRYFDFNKYQDGSNAIRLIWWTSALHLFSKKPLIGYGPVTTDIINMDITGLTNVVHNSFLSILVQYGIIGFFVFLLIPINLFIKSVKNKNILVIAALANICFACLLIEGTLNLALWIILIISTMIVQIKNEEKGLFQ